MSTVTSRTLPDGVIHLHEDLYRIRLDLLTCADNVVGIKDGKISFGNPRYMQVGGKVKAEGLGNERMEQLRESIRAKGLQHPLIVRWVQEDDQFQIVGGECRFRCISKLVADGEECYRSDGTWVSATERYEYIECRLQDLDDSEAYNVALESNESAHSIGDGALVWHVHFMRQAERSDSEILSVCHKSKRWLQETDKILDLDDASFQAFLANEIDRNSALYFTGVQDVELRLTELEEAKEAAKEKILKIRMRHQRAIDKARDEEEDAKAEHVATEHLGGDVNKAGRKVKAAEKKTEKKEQNANEAEQKRTMKVTLGDIKKAKGGKGKNPLSAHQVKTHWLGPIKDLLKADGCDEEGSEICGPCALNLARILCEQITKGEADIEKILRGYRRHQPKWCKVGKEE